MINSYLAQYSVNTVVTEITENASADTVLVHVSANRDRLLPSLVLTMIISLSGFAKIKAFSK